MRRLLSVASLALVVPLLTHACSQADTASVGLAMTGPQGLLDDASGVTLYVFPAGDAVCGADGSAPRPDDAASYPLERCAEGWCGELTLERGPTTQMFSVEVIGGGELTAQGCTTAKVDQDPLELGIKIIRYVRPSCCGDGALQAGELCDTGPAGGECGTIAADAVCEADCSTKELPIDFVDTSNGANGQTHLSLTFAPGNEQLNGALRAAWQTTGAPTSDVGIRYLKPDLFPIDNPPQLATPHRLNLDCDGSDTPIANGQRLPALAPIGGGFIAAFISNFTAPLRDDIQAVVLPATGCTTPAAPLNISDTATGTEPAVSVDVAAAGVGVVLIVWESAGQILGRSVTAMDPNPPVLGPITPIAAGRAPRVAGFAGGWFVAYQGADAGDDDGVFVRKVSTSMTVDPAVLVNIQTAGTQDQPDVAVLADGRFAVAWRSNGQIFFQRHALDGSKIAGDQDAPLQVTAGVEQGAPAIAGTAEIYAVAWEHGSEIRGRLLGADGGFLFNAISGQNDDFPVTRGTAAPRKPAVAIGNYVVFGWEDLGGAAPGIYVRRFPYPS